MHLTAGAGCSVHFTGSDTGGGLLRSGSRSLHMCISQTLAAVGDKHMSVSCTQERASSCCMQSSLLHATQSDHNSVGLMF
jgi:hypothetical protein